MTPTKAVSQMYDVTEDELLGIGQYGKLPEARHALCLALHKFGVRNHDIGKMTGWEQSRISKSLEIARRKMFEPEFNVRVQKLVELIKA